MSDERRAELEAVWAEMCHALADARTLATPHDPKVKAYWCERIGLVLDRVRYARGDDEARPRVEADSRTVTQWLYAKAEVFGLMSDSLGYANAGRDALRKTAREWRDEFPSDRRVPARSPQGEDHEAGIDAAVLAWHAACKDDERLNLRGALDAAIAAYLARVSAPKADENQEAS